MNIRGTPAGRRKEDFLGQRIQETITCVEEMELGLRNINDEDLQPRIATLASAALKMLRTHTPVPKVTLADDLAGLLSTVIALAVPSQDSELGRTATLDRVRQSKGLIVASLLEALDAAKDVGLEPHNSYLTSEVQTKLPRSQIDSLLRGIMKRMSAVEASLNSLEIKNETPSGFSQQNELLGFYVGSMRVQINLAKLNVEIGDKIVDLSVLARAVENMSELTQDFISTIWSWGNRIATDIADSANNIRKLVTRLATGLRAVATRVIRSAGSGAPSRSAESEPSRHIKASSSMEEAIERYAAKSKFRPIRTDIPTFRRYANVICINERVAERYVLQALRAFDEESEPFVLRPRILLYKRFSEFVANDPPMEVEGSPSDNPTPDEIISQLEFPLRQAFALKWISQFNDVETKAVLGSDESTVHDWLHRASRDISRKLSTDVLIIEDSTFIAMDLEAVCLSLGHRVIDVARTHSDAVMSARKRPPGLILADIQLADGSSGLEAVKDILVFSDCPVIFITAYPERFLTAERIERSLLVAKPFSPDQIANLMTRSLLTKLADE